MNSRALLAAFVFLLPACTVSTHAPAPIAAAQPAARTEVQILAINDFHGN
ncbi:MAG: hypothetical protein QOD54_476, partial [Sphingomonadales bacterium]|nr:hypothetical protein [Sphingomonadales bacterium]